MSDARTKLQRVLDDIDPSKTIDPIERKINQALSNFKIQSNTVKSMDEAEALLARFVQAARNAAVGAPADAFADDGINYTQAIHYLSKEYPDQTEYAVRDIMLTGAEGGISQILRAIARAMAEEIALNGIKYDVEEFWNSLSVQEQIKMPDLYIELCGHMLPEHIKGPGRYHLAAFWNVLEQHPGMVKRYRGR